MAHHGTLTAAEDIHIVYAWSYADATARLAATGFLSTDVGKMARQVDTNALYMLTDESPITWVQVGGIGSGYTAEDARDDLGTALTAGAGITITPSDVGNTITIATAGAGAVYTVPLLSAFSWVNQGTASASDTTPGIAMIAPSGSTNVRALVKAAPTPPYVITTHMRIIGIGGLGNGAGLCWYDSTKFVCMTHEMAGSFSIQPMVLARKMTNATTLSADYSGAVTRYQWREEWWRITDDNTNRKCWISNDGTNWIEIHSIGRTDFLTATHVGFFIENHGSSDMKMLVEHWIAT